MIIKSYAHPRAPLIGDDFVIATGEMPSVCELVAASFSEAGISTDWKGSGAEEAGFDVESGEVRARIDPRNFHPAELELLLGDPSEAMEKLAWEPKATFRQLVSMMAQSDLQELSREACLKESEYEVKRYQE